MKWMARKQSGCESFQSRLHVCGVAVVLSVLWWSFIHLGWTLERQHRNGKLRPSSATAPNKQQLVFYRVK